MRNLSRRRSGSLVLGALLVLVATCGTLTAASVNANRQATATRTFWVASTAGWDRIQARLVGSSGTVRIYDGTGRGAGTVDAENVAWEVSNRLLPTERQLFGWPRNLGLVNVLLVPLGTGTLGYFDEGDLLYSHGGSFSSYSNAANVLYVRPLATMPDLQKRSDLYEVIAHELQHLLSFRLRVLDRSEARESNWLNEGLSFYAQLATGFWTPRDRLKVAAAMNDPAWRLTRMDAPGSHVARSRTAYGRAGLFVCYLATRFGSDFVRHLEVQPAPGLSGLNQLLLSRGTTLPAVFADWSMALDYHALAPPAFVRLLRGFHVGPHLLDPIPPGPSGGLMKLRLQPWSSAYVPLHFVSKAPLDVEASSPSNAVRAGVILQDPSRSDRALTRWLQPTRSGTIRGLVRPYRSFDKPLLVISNGDENLRECAVESSDAVTVMARPQPEQRAATRVAPVRSSTLGRGRGRGSSSAASCTE